MHWYGGSIAEAVTLSKQKNAIFVVFVEGDNDLSAEMSATIDDTAVVSRLSNQDNFLAVKLKSGTVNYTHFAQIYQFVPVPSLFFIGRNGTPLEVVCAGVQPDNLATRIDRILAEHHKDKLSTVQPTTSSQHLRQQTTDLIQSEAAAGQVGAAPNVSESSPPKIQKVEPAKVPDTQTQTSRSPETIAPESKTPPQVSGANAKEAGANGANATEAGANGAKSQEYEVVCEGDVCVRRPKAGQGASTSGQGSTASLETENVQSSASGTSIDDKVERVKLMLEAKRKWQAEKDKELEKQKELERRTTGQSVAELKRWQADQELKQIQEERKREKLENNLARQRILEQIAQDRAERRARDAPTAAPIPVPTAPAEPQPTAGDVHSGARLQLKLPDGGAHTAHFDATATLATVHAYIADNLHLPSSEFSLWTAFPRRQLEGSERTLRELQLAPSAALLVLPRRDAEPPRPGFSFISFITQLLTTLVYEPTVQLYNWVRARIFPPPAVAPQPPRGSPQPPRGSPQPPTPGAQASLRRRGNIHRLPGDAPDDENNTWNGNSTQQM